MKVDILRDQRREAREPFIGNIYWKCASESGVNAFSEGIVVNESECGMGILTHTPIKQGCTLELYGEKRWTGSRQGTVRWCTQMETSIYSSGLVISEA
ncbi:MAG: hypothetical protein FIA94_14730 [Nitrospirae bacterium]|nr:hypothetical protein [Nitrospirota bacterium]